MSDESVLVTGAAGFIGSHVSEALLLRGQAVIGVDSFDPLYDESVKRSNLAEVEATARARGVPFDFHRADLLDRAELMRVIASRRCGSVVHLAARAGVRTSIERAADYARSNLEATINVFEAARAAGITRIVAASSSSVYGNNQKVPFAETDPVEEPISPYAATKRACELIAHTYHHIYGLQIALLRFFTVYGPRQRPDLAISRFLSRVSRGETITIFGDGSTSRDYTFIGDIVEGLLAALDRIPRHGLRIWNLGGNHPVELRELVAVIERTVGRTAIVRREPEQPGDVARTYADLTRSSAELGFCPRTTLEDGIKAQWRWLAARGS